MTADSEELAPLTTRAALYLRVSTGRQAEHDLSIPDQRKQAIGFCKGKGWTVAAEYVEPGATATDDRRPEFQRMMDAAAERRPSSTSSSSIPFHASSAITSRRNSMFASWRRTG
jgi:hypothetical protein